MTWTLKMHPRELLDVQGLPRGSEHQNKPEIGPTHTELRSVAALARECPGISERTLHRWVVDREVNGMDCCLVWVPSVGKDPTKGRRMVHVGRFNEWLEGGCRPEPGDNGAQFVNSRGRPVE